MDVLEELARIVAPFDAAVIERALAGAPTVFDVDGQWYAHHHGRPRCIGKLAAFDGEALLAAPRPCAGSGPTCRPATRVASPSRRCTASSSRGSPTPS